MRMFNRPDKMRYKWRKEWDVWSGEYVKCLDVGYRAGWQKNYHWKVANLRVKNEMRADYLIQGVDENADEQPFLPNKPFLVGRAVSLDYCIEQAMDVLSRERNGDKLHHRTMSDLFVRIRYLTREWDSWDRPGCSEPVWYLFGGKLFKVPRTRKILEPFDAIFRSSPEVLYATR